MKHDSAKQRGLFPPNTEQPQPLAEVKRSRIVQLALFATIVVRGWAGLKEKGLTTNLNFVLHRKERGADPELKNPPKYLIPLTRFLPT